MRRGRPSAEVVQGALDLSVRSLPSPTRATDSPPTNTPAPSPSARPRGPRGGPPLPSAPPAPAHSRGTPRQGARTRPGRRHLRALPPADLAAAAAPARSPRRGRAPHRPAPAPRPPPPPLLPAPAPGSTCRRLRLPHQGLPLAPHAAALRQLNPSCRAAREARGRGRGGGGGCATSRAKGGRAGSGSAGRGELNQGPLPTPDTPCPRPAWCRAGSREGREADCGGKAPRPDPGPGSCFRDKPFPRGSPGPGPGVFLRAAGDLAGAGGVGAAGRCDSLGEGARTRWGHLRVRGFVRKNENAAMGRRGLRF